MRKLFNSFVALLITTCTATAQQTVEKLITETRYLLYLPEGYINDTAGKWPLMMFLHGSGESGNDIEKVKTHGPPKLVQQGKRLPFIIVSPQAEVAGGWDAELLYKLLLHVKSKYRVDDDRVYLTGLSMGGFGTWNLAMKHPEMFAAIAPVCGGGDTATAFRLRHVPVWNFHGADDNVVPIINSDNLVAATRLYNNDVTYSVFPGVGHNSWDSAYSNDSLYQWMLTKRRFRYTAITQPVSKINKYEGQYVANKSDTLNVRVDGESLYLQRGTQRFQLNPSAEGSFFIRPEWPVEFVFDQKKKKVPGMTVFSDKRVYYRKVK